MQLRQLDISEIHCRLIDLLCTFATFCNDNGIRYYLAGGTLLGAVRDGKIIAWDDDADVIVPRPDYERLLNIAPEKIGDYGFFAYERSNSFFPHMKFADLTTVIDDDCVGVPHLWLDVFISDGLPDSKTHAEMVLKLACILKRFPSWAQLPYKAGIRSAKSFVQKAVKVVVVPIVKLIEKIAGKGFWAKLITRYATKWDFNDSKYVGAITSSCGICELMKKNDFLQRIPITLEGHEFYAFSNYWKYLVNMFGENWLVPYNDGTIHYTHVFAYCKDGK